MTIPESQAVAERELCGLVNGLAKQIEDHVRQRAATLGLTAPQATALREMTGPMAMRELAIRLGCEPSNATFIVDKLEQGGLIERRPHPTDRRTKQLFLTPAGEELRARLIDLLIERSPLGGLTTEEQRTLHELLNRAVAGPAE
ncbi:MarR family transcriptional regulator [Spongiactinospora rosea]|uniref:MarR family transcriptional regulator n=1 Tax=Spongiactinospora rosea TaxID=2248750 RepID=A0A366M745_9ACTN|nr:MarR family transcriptional regulator [Spongiactinospora rosea]RBQ22061.1 MarR family transcriptional regulator [Spongiactinospora rosea]